MGRWLLLFATVLVPQDTQSLAPPCIAPLCVASPPRRSFFFRSRPLLRSSPSDDGPFDDGGGGASAEAPTPDAEGGLPTSGETLEEILAAGGLNVQKPDNIKGSFTGGAQDRRTMSSNPPFTRRKKTNTWEDPANTEPPAGIKGVPSRRQLQKWERELRAEEQALAAQEQGLINSPDVGQLSRIVEAELRDSYNTGTTTGSPSQPSATR